VQLVTDGLQVKLPHTPVTKAPHVSPAVEQLPQSMFEPQPSPTMPQYWPPEGVQLAGVQATSEPASLGGGGPRSTGAPPSRAGGWPASGAGRRVAPGVNVQLDASASNEVRRHGRHDPNARRMVLKEVSTDHSNSLW
jgi:hypothetical protein